jgi:hypothetical protein
LNPNEKYINKNSRIQVFDSCDKRESRFCERCTILNEFYQITFRKKIYGSIEMLQKDLDEWMQDYNENRPHSGKYCYGKTPMKTFEDSLPLAKAKMLQYIDKVSEQ